MIFRLIAIDAPFLRREGFYIGNDGDLFVMPWKACELSIVSLRQSFKWSFSRGGASIGFLKGILCAFYKWLHGNCSGSWSGSLLDSVRGCETLCLDAVAWIQSDVSCSREEWSIVPNLPMTQIPGSCAVDTFVPAGLVEKHL